VFLKENRMNKIKSLTNRIKDDLTESGINLRIVLLFIPVSFLTYLFHEFGHWIIGEMLGEKMVLSLNNAAPWNGYYMEKIHALYILIGGPAFTILQAIIFFIVIEYTKSIYVYPFVFFAAFCRFFSIIFGGFNRQDEAKISSILNIGTFTVAIIVMLVLFLIVLRSSKSLKLNLKAIGYYILLSTLSILLVIGVDALIT
jgi:hypothetical protein